MSTAPPPLNDLVTKIRGAHPGAYDDMDDATLTKRVLAKYPQYSDLAVPKLQPPLPGALNPHFDPSAPSREETGGTSPMDALKNFGMAAGETAAGVVGAPAIAAAIPAAGAAVARTVASHPMLTSMAASEAVHQARGIPYVGKMIPPYSEMLPFLLSGKNGEAAPAEAEAAEG